MEFGTSDMLAVREVVLRQGCPFSRPRYDLVVDIGAHVGAFSALASGRARRVVAFEPTSRNFRLLSDACRPAPGCRLACHRLAVTGDGRTVEMQIHPRNTGQHSIFGHAETSASVERAESIRSSDLLEFLGVERIDYLKIDAEGSEHEILAGAGTLLQHVSEVFVEINHVDPARTVESAKAVLAQAGFDLRELSKQDQVGLIHAIRTDMRAAP